MTNLPHPQVAKAACILGKERTAAIVADAERDGRDPVSAVKFAMHAHAVGSRPGFGLARAGKTAAELASLVGAAVGIPDALLNLDPHYQAAALWREALDLAIARGPRHGLSPFILSSEPIANAPTPAYGCAAIHTAMRGAR